MTANHISTPPDSSGETPEKPPAQENAGSSGLTVHVGGTTAHPAKAGEPAFDQVQIYKIAEPSQPHSRADAEEKPAKDAHPAEPSPDTSEAEPKKDAPAPGVSQPPILVIDIGGTKVKILATGQTEPRKASSGKDFTPARLVETVRELTHDWDYECVSIGYPGLVGSHGPRSEAGNLGSGWVGFDFAAAFEKPVKMVNDAVMQALGSYEGGRMLFLGLGTGLGSALITGHVVIPLELGQMLYDGDRTLGRVLGRRGLERLGKTDWRKAVNKVVTALMRSFLADYVVIGGGNAKNVKDLPPGVRLGHNLTAFRGGFRLWGVEDVWVLATPGGESPHPSAQEAVRML